MKTTHTIVASVIFALSPIFLHAVEERKEEPRRPNHADWAPNKRETHQEHPQRPAMRDHAMRGSGFMAHMLQNPRMAEAVGLTEEQRAQLQTTEDSIAQERKRLHEEMQKAAVDQARLLTNPEVDEAAVMAAVEKTGAIRTELAKLEMRSLLKTRSILTEEQRNKVKDMMKHRMEQRGTGMRTDRSNSESDTPDRPRKPLMNRDDAPDREHVPPPDSDSE